MEGGHLHSWEDTPTMARLYFKIPQLDTVRPENFKVKYKQGQLSVAIAWPQHVRQSIVVGPFFTAIDSTSIVVSRKGEQVIVNMAKKCKGIWNKLTFSGKGFEELRIDHKSALPLAKVKAVESKEAPKAGISHNITKEKMAIEVTHSAKQLSSRKFKKSSQVEFFLPQVSW